MIKYRVYKLKQSYNGVIEMTIAGLINFGNPFDTFEDALEAINCYVFQESEADKYTHYTILPDVYHYYI